MRWIIYGAFLSFTGWVFSPAVTGNVMAEAVISPENSAVKAASDAWVAMAERFGLWAALCVIMVGVIVWFSWKRECRMAVRIDALEAARNAADVNIATALTKNGTSLDQMNVSMNKIIEIQNEQLQAQQQLNVELRCRPCIRQ